MWLKSNILCFKYVIYSDRKGANLDLSHKPVGTSNRLDFTSVSSAWNEYIRLLIFWPNVFMMFTKLNQHQNKGFPYWFQAYYTSLGTKMFKNENLSQIMCGLLYFYLNHSYIITYIRVSLWQGKFYECYMTLEKEITFDINFVKLASSVMKFTL